MDFKKKNVYLHSGVLLRCLKEIMKFVGKCMEQEKKIILNEVAQSQKDKHAMNSFISGY